MNNLELDKKNEFIRQTNLLICDYQQLCDIISHISFNEFKLENVAKLYRDKILELDQYYAQKGLSFFGTGAFQTEIALYLEGNLLQIMYYGADIASKIKKYDKYYLFGFTAKIADKKLQDMIFYYNGLCDKLAEFTINDGLEDVINFNLNYNTEKIESKDGFLAYLKYIQENLIALGIITSIEVCEEQEVEETSKTFFRRFYKKAH